MDKKRLKQFIRNKSRLDGFLIFFNIAFIIGSMAGIIWVAGDNHRTLFGEKINIIESRMLKDEKMIENYKPLAGSESEQLKSMALKYCGLSQGQNSMIKQLIDLGFLGFLFWNGVYGLAMSVSFKRFTKNIERILDESSAPN